MMIASLDTYPSLFPHRRPHLGSLETHCNSEEMRRVVYRFPKLNLEWRFHLVGLWAAAALGIVPGRVIARRPVRIGLVRSFVGVKYAGARHSTVTIRGTSVVNFRLSRHPCGPLVRWLKSHGRCRCCDRQGEHYGEKPHYSFLLGVILAARCRQPLYHFF